MWNEGVDWIIRGRVLVKWLSNGRVSIEMEFFFNVSSRGVELNGAPFYISHATSCRNFKIV